LRRGSSFRLWRGRIERGLVLEMYSDMLFIRGFEERLADLLEMGMIRCPVHLYIGEEAVAVGVCKTLSRSDWVFSTHRSHGHYLAKGGDPGRLLDEIFCFESGCSKGHGGSMHVCDIVMGLPGSCAIVGGTVPLAVGAAYAFKDSGRVAVSFFGDGALCEGVVWESFNLAALWRVPVVFVVENNLYSTHLHVSACHACSSPDDFVARAEAFGVPAISVDGNNVLEVFRAARFAVDQARSGLGPFLIVANTYRWRGHVGPSFDFDKPIRPRSEVEEWMARCPISRLREFLRRGGFDGGELMLIEAGVESRLDRLFERIPRGRQPSWFGSMPTL